MQTALQSPFKDSSEGREADAILRSCVHCGFCLAACPTYRLLGDELDSPRGRIYLIKQLLEGQAVGAPTQLHLDRCLTCRACETACPSGVRYGRLLDIGRGLVEQRVPRGADQRLERWLLRRLVAEPRRFGLAVALGRALAPLLPRRLTARLPLRQAAPPWPKPQAAGRRMLALAGCAQSVATPATNAAAARVLARFGIELIEAPAAGCCGALDYHLGAHDAGLARARRNIDAWWPYLQQGAETIVMTASGCGAMVREYGLLLAQDPAYADKAERVAGATRDLGEVLLAEDRSPFAGIGAGRRIAFHAPCTLTHWQKASAAVETVLREADFELTPVVDSHLCCGSAGSYSILQPELAQRLRDDKLTALTAGEPEVIVTANIGCQLHLQRVSEVPVRHWIELLEASSSSRRRDQKSRGDCRKPGRRDGNPVTHGSARR
ncbi:MAG: glycolate oxidase subunit GlcF [Gammaproteobacteria bacterium]|nr:glycolate oxidase subunit GlcF [Gammaproteobacteria bacterium]